MALEILKRVGLENKAQSFPATFSGGEQQRVAISRALVMKPDLIFADEPTGNLDKKTSDEIQNLLFEFNKTEYQTFVIVTHNPAFAQKCPRKFELKEGQLVDKE